MSSYTIETLNPARMAIIKHNKLIETSYKLNSREQFFVLNLISQISQSENSFKEYTMHYSEIEKMLNFDGKRRIANKHEVFSLMDKLNSEPILYEKGSIIGRSVWLQHMEHDTDTDEFTFSLSEKLREYLIQLKEHFTRYNISNIVYLNGNAVRLYEVLKRHQFKGNCEIKVDKLKFFLGIEDNYPKFYEFKRWVLLPAQREIEKYTDIRFEFTAGKKERKRIISLKFTIYENEPEYTPDTMKLLSKIDKSIKPKASLERLESKSEIINSEFDSRGLAYDFLYEKGVNGKFITMQIFRDPKFNYEPLQGYEDLYIKAVWKFFTDKSNSPSPAGAFVTWWKNGKFTEDNFHAHMIELVINKRKTMKESERNRRDSSKNNEILQTESNNGVGEYMETIQLNMNKPKFDLEHFKEMYPQVYRAILNRVKKEYENAFLDANQPFDPHKYRKAIEAKVYHECSTWMKEV